eukprot:SAG31_NODE_519_length_14648_cov_24.224895_2_plen_155_part_00
MPSLWPQDHIGLGEISQSTIAANETALGDPNVSVLGADMSMIASGNAMARDDADVSDSDRCTPHSDLRTVCPAPAPEQAPRGDEGTTTTSAEPTPDRVSHLRELISGMSSSPAPPVMNAGQPAAEPAQEPQSDATQSAAAAAMARFRQHPRFEE